MHSRMSMTTWWSDIHLYNYTICIISKINLSQQYQDKVGMQVSLESIIFCSSSVSVGGTGLHGTGQWAGTRFALQNNDNTVM